MKKVKNYNAILTVVDRFTKQIHAIPTSDKLNSEGLAQLFRDNIWKYHGLPKTVISDRGPQFASNFTKELNKILGIHTKLSTAFHPQTNGQTERANQEIEQYLRMFVNQRQDNWPEWLALAEFAHNNRIQASTQTSPFNALYGRNPRMGFEPHRRSKNEAVQDFTQRMKKVQEEVASAISKAQTEMKKYADRNRKEAPKFKIGDQVLLSTANLSTTSPAKKLDDKWIGPYKITKVLPNGNAVTLDLPKDLTIHNTVNITNVKSFTTPQAHQPNRPTNPPPIVNGPQAGQFEVESILDSRVNRRRKPDDNIEFLIKWKGYDNSENTWEPAKNVQDAPEKVADYYRQHPDAPKQQTKNLRAVSNRPGVGKSYSLLTRHGMVPIPQGNGPYERNSKDGQQKVEGGHDSRGLKTKEKDQDVLAQDIIVALTPELISAMSQHKRWAKYMHKRLPSVKRLWITSSNKMITHIAEVNPPVQHTDYLADRSGLLPWKYRFT